MTEQIKFNHEIIKSLLLIVSFTMFGYITIIILLQMVPLLISDLASQYFISHLTVLILAISAIINAPVLYFYR